MHFKTVQENVIYSINSFYDFFLFFFFLKRKIKQEITMCLKLRAISMSTVEVSRNIYLFAVDIWEVFHKILGPLLYYLKRRWKKSTFI